MNERRDESNQITGMSEAVRIAGQFMVVVVGVVGLWFAVQYAIEGRWAVAILLFVSFGVMEASVIAAQLTRRRGPTK